MTKHDTLSSPDIQLDATGALDGEEPLPGSAEPGQGDVVADIPVDVEPRLPIDEHLSIRSVIGEMRHHLRRRRSVRISRADL